MIVLDSDRTDARDRVDLITTVLSEASDARVVVEPHPAVHARIDVWRLGALELFRNESSGIAMTCDRRRAGRSAVPVVALAVHERSRARHEQFGHRHDVGPGDLMAVDLDAEFAFSWRTQGASRALRIPAPELGLPMDVVRTAVTRIGASPLARTVSAYVVDLFRDADRLAAGPDAGVIGDAGIALARALLATAAGRDEVAREVHHETLLAQIREYLRQHLRDPDLGADTIARAHHISPRQLYRLFADADLSLEQLVIAQRLDGAARELASPRAEATTIAALALRWGFRDPGHFGRRFRDAFGVTPRAYRAAAGALRAREH